MLGLWTPTKALSLRAIAIFAGHYSPPQGKSPRPPIPSRDSSGTPIAALFPEIKQANQRISLCQSPPGHSERRRALAWNAHCTEEGKQREPSMKE
jgi:hypothetical protein